MSTDIFRPLKAFIVETPTRENEEAFDFFIESAVDLTPLEQEIFDFLVSFVDTHDGLPSFAFIKNHFVKIARTSVVEYLELLETLPNLTLTDFKAYLKQKEDAKKDGAFQDILKQSGIIFTAGKTVGKETLKGRADAINYLNGRMDEVIDHHKSRQVGTLREDAADAWLKYLDRKNNPTEAYGITSGFYALDKVIKGGKAGELHFVLGYTSSGKSLFSVNYAYNAACILGRNVVIFSLEMDKHQLLTLLYCIHSAHEKFQHIHAPISKEDFDLGTLDEEAEDFLKNYVIADLHNNPEYGEILIEYPGEGLTLSTLRSKLMAIQRNMSIDMLIVDYPELMTPDKGQKYSDYGTSLNTIIKGVKQLALTFNNGKGLFVLCPYQANRDGYERATKNFGVYDLRAMSYANEAERACDIIYSVYKEVDTKSPHVIVSNLKNRRGSLFESFKMSVLWPSGYMNVDTPQTDIDLESFDWDT